MHSDSQLLDSLLEPGVLTALFHPIYQVSRDRGTSVWAVEALLRGPHGSDLESAGKLFDFVRRQRAEPQVDRVCIRTALEAAAGIGGELAVAVNVHASTLGRDAGFVPFLLETTSQSRFTAERIIVEIVEQVPTWHAPTYRRSIDQLRIHGFRLALDDLGVGYSNLGLILETRPHVIKIDGSIVRGCHSDYYRWAVVEWSHTLAARLGAWSLAEGIEDQADLAAVTACGIGLVQGYVFCRPMSVADLAGIDLLARARLVLSDLPEEAA